MRFRCIRRLASTQIAGRATTAGTREFVIAASLPVHHCFDLKQLYINPIIHGPPHSSRASTLTAEDTEICLAQALLRNKSNCFYVYHHFAEGQKPWAASSLQEILGAGGIGRQSVVTIAGLGRVGPKDVAVAITDRLAEATALSNLQEIDCAIVECDDDTFRDGTEGLSDAILCLEKLCEDGKLSFYGLHINVTPYLYHTPPLKLVGALAMIPPLIEESLRRDAVHGDVIMYTISPTSALPATYPMLDPDEFDLELLESKQRQKRGDDDDDGDAEEGLDVVVSEKTRQFTRIGMHALLCRRGRGVGDVEEEEEADLAKRAEDLSSAADKPDAKLNAALEMEIQEHAKLTLEGDGEFLPLVSSVLPRDIEHHLAEALDSLCPSLQSTPLLQDKALRIVMSVGVDAVVVDAELSAALDKITLSPDQLLPSAATDDIFGNFVIPRALLVHR